MSIPVAEATRVTRFWLGPSDTDADTAEAQRPRWYRGGAQLDADIVAQFMPVVAAALEGALESWRQTPIGSLALVIALDQFTRNVYRGTPRAYAGDARAMAIAESAVAGGQDQSLSLPGRLFLYHPYHHSEVLAEQNRGVALLERLREQAPPAWRAWAERRVDGFAAHRDIVARFGRFPHRNAVLGRSSTAAEEDFLAADANSYGQSPAVQPAPDGP